jgi:predicted lipoprotein with Yx(FWY)xxD motif
MRRLLAALSLAAAVGLLVAGTSSAAGSRATVKTRHGKLGTFLVAANGKSLYLFEKDKTTKSTCYGQCAKFWPPLLTTRKAKVGGKARRSLLGTTRRRDGKRQVTYKGHPLYFYSEDSGPGDTAGEGLHFFGGGWYVLAPNGKKIDKD